MLTAEATQVVNHVAPADVVRLGKVAEIHFGLTVKAMESMIYRGDWLEGCEYTRAPNGTIWLLRDGIRAWALGQRK